MKYYLPLNSDIYKINITKQKLIKYSLYHIYYTVCPFLNVLDLRF